MIKKTLCFLLALFSFSLLAQVKSALFIGNSYTYVNNLPQMVKDLALSKGDTLFVDASALGGYTLNNHSTYTPTLTKINQQAWDYIVLQEQSQLPSFSPSQVASDVYPYAQALNNLILANDSCTETLFFMTWGRQNGDASNCAFYPPVCTYNGMQMRLRSSYIQMASNNHASVSPVGVAWKIARDSMPAINFYDSDGSHPSIYGSYLAACVFYSSIYHKPSLGAIAPPAISLQDATKIQTVADFTVLDSLNFWQDTGDMPNSHFNYSANGNIVQFQNQSNASNSYIWNFGDGNFGVGLNPQNNYLNNGNYTVSCIASNNCKQYFSYDTVHITSTNLQPLLTKNSNSTTLFPNPTNGDFQITFAISGNYTIMIYNSLGALVKSSIGYSTDKISINAADLAEGIYFLTSQLGKSLFAQKLIIQKD